MLKFILCCNTWRIELTMHVEHLQVDILLNNAGLALGTAKVHENSIEVYMCKMLSCLHD